MLESDSPTQFRAVLEKYREDLLTKNKEGSRLSEAGPVTFGLRLNCSHFPAGYPAISYGRGTWLFHMLRYMTKQLDNNSLKFNTIDWLNVFSEEKVISYGQNYRK